MRYIVYKTINIKNNKFYIGIHSTNNINDGYMGSGSNIRAAIKEFGKNSFIREILYEGNTREDITIMESIIVDEFFVEREDTYNIALGGIQPGKTMSFRARKLISEARSNMIGHKCTDVDLQEEDQL